MSGVLTLKFSRKARQMCPQSEPQLSATVPKVRPYQPGDSEAVFEICRQSPEAAQWTKESYEQAHSSGQIVLIAEINAQVCGFLVARITADEAEILNTAVDPTLSSQGHRKLAYLERQFRQHRHTMSKAFIWRFANPIPRRSLFMPGTVLRKQQSVMRTTVVLQRTP